MHNILTFLNMGGYGPFIWTAYIVMGLVFTFNLGLPLREFRRIKARLRSKR